MAAGTGSSGASLATGTSAFPGKAADFSGSETPHPKSAAFRVPRPLLYALAAATLLLLPTLAFGQDVSIDFGDDTTLTERAVQLVGLITVLALAPSILVMVTSFTRIVVVLSLLRTAIGL